MKSVFSFLFLFIQVSLWSQDTLKLSLDEAIKIALKQNPTLIKSQLDEAFNQSRIREITGSGLPQINVSGGFTDNFSLATQLLPGEIFNQPGTQIPVKFGTKFVSVANGNVQQMLFNKSILTGIKAAKSSQQFYALYTLKTKEDLVYQVAKLYIELELLKTQEKIAEDNIKRAKKLLDISTNQYAEGIIKKVDVSQQTVNITNQETERYQYSLQYTQLANLFKVVLNLPIAQPLIIGDKFDMQKLAQEPNTFNLNNNVGIKILDVQKDLYNLERKNIAAGYFPVLGAYFNYTGQNMQQQFFKGQSNSYLAGSWGLNLQVPIFDGGIRRQKIVQNKIRMQQLAQDRIMAAEQIEANYNNAMLQVNQNKIVLLTQEKNMHLAEELYTIANASFIEGVASLSEMINAENALFRAQQLYLTALLQNNLAQIELLKVSGNITQLTNN